METEYPVDSKLKLNQYRRSKQPVSTDRQRLEQQLEVANYGEMIKKSEGKQ